MKKRVSFLVATVLLGLLAVFLVGCSGGSQSTNKQESGQSSTPDVIKLVLAHPATPDNSLYLVYEKFAQLVEQKSAGKMKIEVHPSGTLAGDTTAVEGVKLGTIDIGSAGSNVMGTFTKAFLFADLPYIFKSIEDSHKVWWGPIGEEIKKQAESDLNAKVLFFADTGGGFRVLANNERPIKVPADLNGIKLRATPSQIEISLLKNWGASPTPIPWPEVYSSLQQKVVLGLHQQPVWIYNAKLYEGLKYATEVGAMANVHIALINKKKWDSLTPDLQKVLEEASKEAQEYSAKVDAEKGIEAKDKLIKAGIEFYTPTAAEMEQWRNVTQGVWDLSKNDVPPTLIQRILDAQK